MKVETTRRGKGIIGTPEGWPQPTRSRSSPFLATLEAVQESERGKAAEAMLAEMDAQAERFRQAPNLVELLRYKELARRFLAQALRRIYGVAEVTSWRGGRRKVYLIVRRLDAALEELIRLFFSRAENTALMAKMDEIRGLLLDLYT